MNGDLLAIIKRELRRQAPPRPKGTLIYGVALGTVCYAAEREAVPTVVVVRRIDVGTVEVQVASVGATVGRTRPVVPVVA